MAHSYTSEYPSSVSFDPAYKKFFEDFYKVSDTPDIHEQYVENFTKDATLVMAQTKVQGTEGILALRKGLWDRVSVRHHRPYKIFPFGPDSDEVMLHGNVDFELKDGSTQTKDWSAHAHLVKVDGVVKMKFYQVYMDTAPPPAK
ncbi:hypothetical protein P280DRAFT_113591 [Massarina eburnea CBS 473.64]|uniref:SnoaL-like domain-containing protein n=1 Tax=Massarina eburnea CBS 473.64 TaxID=1395130 RepID=A0A6A6RPG4_9PLEO|nr:hypothetical protein P280DRAFT_113591 [Massarina eburnea CBS 473.64]